MKPQTSQQTTNASLNCSDSFSKEKNNHVWLVLAIIFSILPMSLVGDAWADRAAGSGSGSGSAGRVATKAECEERFKPIFKISIGEDKTVWSGPGHVSSNRRNKFGSNVAYLTEVFNNVESNFPNNNDYKVEKLFHHLSDGGKNKNLKDYVRSKFCALDDIETASGQVKIQYGMFSDKYGVDGNGIKNTPWYRCPNGTYDRTDYNTGTSSYVPTSLVANNIQELCQTEGDLTSEDGLKNILEAIDNGFVDSNLLEDYEFTYENSEKILRVPAFEGSIVDEAFAAHFAELSGSSNRRRNRSRNRRSSSNADTSLSPIVSNYEDADEFPFYFSCPDNADNFDDFKAFAGPSTDLKTRLKMQTYFFARCLNHEGEGVCKPTRTDINDSTIYLFDESYTVLHIYGGDSTPIEFDNLPKVFGKECALGSNASPQDISDQNSIYAQFLIDYLSNPERGEYWWDAAYRPLFLNNDDIDQTDPGPFGKILVLENVSGSIGWADMPVYLMVDDDLIDPSRRRGMDCLDRPMLSLFHH